jgi:hypothetical protein
MVKRGERAVEPHRDLLVLEYGLESLGDGGELYQTFRASSPGCACAMQPR